MTLNLQVDVPHNLVNLPVNVLVRDKIQPSSTFEWIYSVMMSQKLKANEMTSDEKNESELF